MPFVLGQKVVQVAREGSGGVGEERRVKGVQGLKGFDLPFDL